MLYGITEIEDKILYSVRTILEPREGAGYEISKIGIVENIRAIKTQQVGTMVRDHESRLPNLLPANSVKVSEFMDYVKNNIKARDSIHRLLVEQ